MLEDIDFYCVDNIPAALLKAFISTPSAHGRYPIPEPRSVWMHAPSQRNETIPALVGELRAADQLRGLYLHASDEVLLKPMRKRRRKHPLGDRRRQFARGHRSEAQALETDHHRGGLSWTRPNMGVHALRELIRRARRPAPGGRLSIMFESFGYKYGIPAMRISSSMCRSLPNPYWDMRCALSTADETVIEYLSGYAACAVIAELIEFLERARRRIRPGESQYLTIAVGCTGGQHRWCISPSKARRAFSKSYPQVLTRHDSLQKP